MEEHYFGGAWTEIKLDILKEYLTFYTQALKKQGFKLLYIDACAGTGSRNEIIPELPIIGLKEEKITLDGSAKIALGIDQQFDRYLFIENNKSRITELEKLKIEYPRIYIKIEEGDANKVIIDLAEKSVWDKNIYRGVIFLDPYGLEIKWKTLEAIARTKSFDIWFLFSISGVYRQASHNFEKIEPYKRKILDELFGTREWREAFYVKKTTQGLFDTIESHARKVNVKQIEEWVQKRLNKCFSYTSEPLPLPKTGPQLFSLFFCVSNSSGKAVELAKKVANHILKQH